MEYQDVYNENKERTGKVVVRGTPLEKDEYVLCVGCWVVNERGEIFITRRSPEKRFAPNLWENTGGGAMAGEDGKDAILRELFEETGIRAEKSELIMLAELRKSDIFTEDYVIVKDFPIENVVLQPHETCDAAWVSEEKWEEMLISGEIAPSVYEALKPFKEKFLQILHCAKK